ncbi:hypothetical protein GCM10010994_51720 [Chelatococcus reniformis]|uniref:Uncharacterized protein n=1 Tax=Chelatococcus reniformis TaxID=1494448 RepID=A0A916XMN6_9HYPH|nr:hypothetical protein GCM10010994_51720 [Chelatococcus reniformis]
MTVLWAPGGPADALERELSAPAEQLDRILRAAALVQIEDEAAEDMDAGARVAWRLRGRDVDRSVAITADTPGRPWKLENRRSTCPAAGSVNPMAWRSGAERLLFDGYRRSGSPS